MGKRKGRARRCGVAVVALLLIGLVAFGCAPTPDAVVVETPCVVQRLLPVVWAGSESAGTIPKLEDDAEQPLPAGSLVRTDAMCEAMLNIDGCHHIYLFFDSEMIKAACPKSSYNAGDITCAVSGSSVHNNSCGSEVRLQTTSAEIVLEGTWVWLAVIPELELALLVVGECQAEVWPVTEPEGRVLGQPVEVPAQHFLFTAPDAVSLEIATLPPRVSHPLTELPPVVHHLQLGAYVGPVRQQAARDGVPFPWPTLTASPVPADTPTPTEERPTDTAEPPAPTDMPAPTNTPLHTDTP